MDLRPDDLGRLERLLEREIGYQSPPLKVERFTPLEHRAGSVSVEVFASVDHDASEDEIVRAVRGALEGIEEEGYGSPAKG